MPTIQLKLSEEDFNELLEMTGEKTGIKAVKQIIKELKEEQACHLETIKELSYQAEMHEIYREKVAKISEAMKIIKNID